MIIGIGSDMVDIRRIEALLERYGDKFIARCFTEAEQEVAERRAGQTGNRKTSQSRAATYAKRFAAKEACAKALGTGIGEAMRFTDIEVIRHASGRPELRLHGGAKALLASIAGDDARLHVSLTDEPPYAQAFVVIEALRDV